MEDIERIESIATRMSSVVGCNEGIQEHHLSRDARRIDVNLE